MKGKNMTQDQKNDASIEDVDPIETQEWIDALDAVMAEEGVERAHYLLEKLEGASRLC